jgi:uncharacterized protein
MSEEATTPVPAVNIIELSEHLCKLVVKDPSQVKVKENKSNQTVILTAQVADEDIGRVIGKQGSTIRSMRYLLDQVGRKHKMKIYFEIKNKQTNETKISNETKATEAKAEDITESTPDTEETTAPVTH